jgi:hypothetical protein
LPSKQKQYKAKTAPNLIEIEPQLMKSKLTNDKDNQDKWITQLEAIHMNKVKNAEKVQSLIMIWYSVF